MSAAQLVGYTGPTEPAPGYTGPDPCTLSLAERNAAGPSGFEKAPSPELRVPEVLDRFSTPTKFPR